MTAPVEVSFLLSLSRATLNAARLEYRMLEGDLPELGTLADVIDSHIAWLDERDAPLHGPHLREIRPIWREGQPARTTCLACILCAKSEARIAVLPTELTYRITTPCSCGEREVDCWDQA